MFECLPEDIPDVPLLGFLRLLRLVRLGSGDDLLERRLPVDDERREQLQTLLYLKHSAKSCLRDINAKHSFIQNNLVSKSSVSQS